LGFVSYEITLFLPNGKPASGAEIIAFNKNAIAPSSKTFYGATNNNGYYKWAALATGYYKDTYDFKAQKELEGILYIAHWTDRLDSTKGPYIQEITMRTEFFEELKKFDIPTFAIDGLQRDSQMEILTLINELNICIAQKLPNASISVGTKILEGLIRIYLNRLGKWKEDMNKKTFGQLLGSLKGTDLENIGLYNKLDAINSFRIPAVHFKGTDTTIDEARIGNSVIVEFLKILYPSTSSV
jgi:hypothetical protein